MNWILLTAAFIAAQKAASSAVNSPIHFHSAYRVISGVDTQEIQLMPVSSLVERSDIPPVATVSATSTYAAQSADGKFRFNLDCSAPANSTSMPVVGGDQFCAWALDTFTQVGEELSSILALAVPITFNARIRSFCTTPNGNPVNGSGDTVSSTDCKSVLGYGKPTFFYELSSTDPSLSIKHAMYPQPLVRQILAAAPVGSSAPVLADVDSELDFNSDAPLWFEAMGRDIASDEYDFHYLVAHECLHALGMVSLLSQFRNGSLLAPQVAASGVAFLRPSAFDVHLESNDGSWADLTDGLDAILSNSSSTTSDAQSKAQKLYQLATTERSTWFKFAGSDSKAYVVNTVPPFAIGTSLIHIDASDRNLGEEFLMRPAAPLDASLESLTGKNLYGPYGRLTVGVLATIGYPVQPNVAETLDLSSAYRPSMSLALGIFSSLFIFTLS